MLNIILLSLLGIAGASLLVDEILDDDDSDTPENPELEVEPEPVAEPETNNPDFGMQLVNGVASVSLSAEDVAALAAADTEDLTYYDYRSFTFEIEADAAGDGYLHLVSSNVTFTEEDEDGSTVETTYKVAVLVLSDSEEVPDGSQVSFDENGELVTDGVDAIAAAYVGFDEYVDDRFKNFDYGHVHASAEDSALTSVFGGPSTLARITGSENDIGLPISEDGTVATIELTAEDLSRYSTTEVPSGGSDGYSYVLGDTHHYIDDSADVLGQLSYGIETLNIEIPEGFDVVEVEVTHVGIDTGDHDGNPTNDNYRNRTYYVLVEEGTQLDADDITVYSFLENGYYGDEGADKISIDGDYGFILGLQGGLEIVLTGNVTAPSQSIDLTIEPDPIVLS